MLARVARECGRSDGARTLGEREVLEQRDDVGEGLVEGADVVGLVGVEIAAVHAVEQRVRRLVRDDVVRQAREHHARLGCGK